MNYTREDYRDLYNDRWQDKRGITKWEWLVVALFAILVSLQWGCDSEAAEFTAKAEQEAHAKKQALLTMPCTWVAQCAHPISDCPVEKRVCVNANLEAK